MAARAELPAAAPSVSCQSWAPRSTQKKPGLSRSSSCVGASYPKYGAAGGKAEPWEFGSDELLAMTVFVQHQSQGMAVNVEIDGPAAPVFERGKAHFYQRRGQLDMSCAQCHDLNHGKLLRGDLLSQARPGPAGGGPGRALVSRPGWVGTATPAARRQRWVVGLRWF